MHLEMLRVLYAHGAWANGRVLEAAERLTPEQWRTPVLDGLAGVHDTLAHLVDVQELWLDRWCGASPAAMPHTADAPDLAALRTRWDGVEAETRAFVAALGTDEEHDPGRVVTYTNTRGRTWAKPLWQLMLQQAMHAAQHRSGVAAMLTAFGHSPGLLDLVFFLDVPDGGR